MTDLSYRVAVALLVLIGIFRVPSADGQDMALGADCEAGFRRFIQMAQSGRLGATVTNANVGIVMNYARVELLCEGMPNKHLLLKPTSSAKRVPLYSPAHGGGGAAANVGAGGGKALDEAFAHDPFQFPEGFVEAVPGDDSIPRLTDAWVNDGWRGVVRVVERQMLALAGVSYTIRVIVALAIGLLASLVVILVSTPPLSSRR